MASSRKAGAFLHLWTLLEEDIVAYPFQVLQSLTSLFQSLCFVFLRAISSQAFLLFSLVHLLSHWPPCCSLDTSSCSYFGDLLVLSASMWPPYVSFSWLCYICTHIPLPKDDHVIHKRVPCRYMSSCLQLCESSLVCLLTVCLHCCNRSFRKPETLLPLCPAVSESSVLSQGVLCTPQMFYRINE